MTNPLLGSLDPNEFDRCVRPQDDLYRFVNGRWLESHQIPADRAIDGVFYTLRDRSEAQVRVIIEDCVAGKVSGDLAGKVAALYGDFMDESKVEDEAPAVLQGLRSGVEAVADKAALRDLWARTWTEGVYEGWFDMGVDVDLNNPEAYVNYFAQDGIGLPERAYYLEEKHAEIWLNTVRTWRGCWSWRVMSRTARRVSAWPDRLWILKLRWLNCSGTTSRLATPTRRTTPCPSRISRR